MFKNQVRELFNIRLWDRVTLISVTTPLTKITKKIKNWIINNTRELENINNQLILFMLLIVNKYSILMEV